MGVTRLDGQATPNDPFRILAELLPRSESNMPKRGKPKRNARKLSENSKAKLARIGDEVSSDNLEQCLKDFDAQGQLY